LRKFRDPYYVMINKVHWKMT